MSHGRCRGGTGVARLGCAHIPRRTVPQDPWRTLAEASVTVAIPLKRLFCDLGRTWGGGEEGASGLSIGGARVDRAPPPPKKRAQLTGPQNPTETDPQASEVTQTQNSAKNEKFWNQRVEGDQKSHQLP